MQDLLKLQQKIVPEFIELLKKRYNILRTIYYNQPIGRRILADELSLGERFIRNEVNFLKDENLIEIQNAGMYVTTEGEEIIDKLKEFIHELKGLSTIEESIKNYLNIKKVLIVPGDVEKDETVLQEVGRVAASYVKEIICDNMKIAITGGTSVKELVNNMPKISDINDVLVLPARGGMGRGVELQANTLAAKLAGKIGGSYKLLHVPDNLSPIALETMLKEKSISEIVSTIRNSNLLIHGIGRADEMAAKRELSTEKIRDVLECGAVGEAFGHYFNMQGEIVYYNPTIGVTNDDTKTINNLVAVAAGSSKAGAIIGTEINRTHSTLITDEGAANEILRVMQGKS